MADGKCYVRDDFGRSGVVDARQCGIVGDGLPAGGSHPDDGMLLQNCLNAASGVGVPVVNTGGGVILDDTTALSIPANVHVTCGATNPSGSGGNDFRIFKGNDPNMGLNISNAIVIYPTLMPPDAVATSPIQALDRGAAISGCLIVASAGTPDANGIYPNPYAPSRWYPGCDPNFLDCSGNHDTGTAHIRSAILEYSAFNPNPSVAYPKTASNPSGGGPVAHDIAIAVGDPQTEMGGGGTTLGDLTVVGFGTCLLGTAPGLVTRNVNGDCDTGVNLSNVDNPQVSKSSIGPDLTTGDIAYLPLQDAGAEFSGDSQGQYRITVGFDGGDSGFRLMNGDTVWVVPQPGSGAQSAAGRWTVSCTPVTGGACPVIGSTQSFSLKNSICSTPDHCPSGGLALTGHVTAGSNEITGVSFFNSDGTAATGASFVSVGQTITDSGTGGSPCIPSGAKVTQVWPAARVAFISANATCSTIDTPDQLTFKDTAYTGGAANCMDNDGAPKGCVVVDTSFRFGDAFYGFNAGGFRLTDSTTFEHEISVHLDTGSRGDLVNFATGNNIGLPDRNLAALNAAATVDPNLQGNMISLFVEGKHTGGGSGTDLDACNVHLVNSVLGQHRTAAIVVQSDCADPDKFDNVGIDVDNHGGNGIGLEVDGGTVLFENGDSGTGGAIFKADAMPFGQTSLPAALHISNSRFTSAPLIFSNDAAQQTTYGCGNVFQTFIGATPHFCAQ